MKTNTTKTIILITVLTLLISIASINKTYAAEKIELIILPKKTTVQPNDEILVEFKFNSTSLVVGLDFFVEYPESLIKYVDDNDEVLQSSGSLHILYSKPNPPKKEGVIYTLKFKVQSTAQTGAKIEFKFRKDSNYPKGTIDGDDVTIESSEFKLGTATIDVVIPTPTPTKAPTPTPTKIPPPTPTKAPTATPKPGENTPTPTVTPTSTNEVIIPDDSPTPSTSETSTPENTASPTYTPEMTTTPTTTEIPKIIDNSIDIWAYIFWAIVSVIVGVWIGIGIGYMIWGRRSKNSMFRYRGKF